LVSQLRQTRPDSSGHGAKRARAASTGEPRLPHYLFRRWAEVSRRIRAAQHIVLFLDFDGTLAALRRYPRSVSLSQSTRRIIGSLARHPVLSIYVVSGRRLVDLRRRARMPGLHYVGLHGWEVRDGARLPAKTRKVLRRARELIADQLGNWRGIWLEDKELSFGVHYHEAAQKVIRRAEAVVRRTLEHFEPHLRVLEGKKVWEFLPREIAGKGAAVLEVLAQLPAAPLTIYVGDDITDESAFAALPRGITVRVGKASDSTRARFGLRNPAEVRCFLRKLEGEIN